MLLKKVMDSRPRSSLGKIRNRNGLKSGLSSTNSKIYGPTPMKKGFHHRRIMTASQASLKLREPSILTADTKSLKKTED